MKRLWAIIPAAVLAVGAVTAGVLTNAASADKKSISIDYLPAPSNDSGRIDEKTSTSTVSSPAGTQSYLINNGNGFCDNYIDGVCWQDGSGCGYHHGNGGYADNNSVVGFCDNYIDGVCWQDGSGCGYHHGNGNHHGNSSHHGNGNHH